MNQLKLAVKTILLAATSLFAANLAAFSLGRFDSVEQVEADLRSSGEAKMYEDRGWLIAEAGHTIWSFTQAGHPAHPAVVEREVYEADGAIRIRTRQICTAGKSTCADLRKDFVGLNNRVAESASGKPNANESLIRQPGLELRYDSQFGWSISRRESGLLVLIKKGPAENESVVGSAQLFRAEAYASPSEFLVAEKNRRIQNHASDPRVKDPVASEKLVAHGDAQCVSYNYRYKDTGAQLADGSMRTANFSSRGLRCIHPENASIGVALGYSKRYFEDLELDEDALTVASQVFFNSVRFIPFESNQ